MLFTTATTILEVVAAPVRFSRQRKKPKREQMSLEEKAASPDLSYY
jgi:hypothetical protein